MWLKLWMSSCVLFQELCIKLFRILSSFALNPGTHLVVTCASVWDTHIRTCARTLRLALWSLSRGTGATSWSRGDFSLPSSITTDRCRQSGERIRWKICVHFLYVAGRYSCSFHHVPLRLSTPYSIRKVRGGGGGCWLQHIIEYENQMLFLPWGRHTTRKKVCLFVCLCKKHFILFCDVILWGMCGLLAKSQMITRQPSPYSAQNLQTSAAWRSLSIYPLSLCSPAAVSCPVVWSHVQ